MTKPKPATSGLPLASPLRRAIRRYRRTGRHRLSRRHIGWEGDPRGLASLHTKPARDGA